MKGDMVEDKRQLDSALTRVNLVKLLRERFRSGAHNCPVSQGWSLVNACLGRRGIIGERRPINGREKMRR